MTAASDVLFAFTREQAEKCMMDVVKNLDDTSLKNSIYMLMMNYAPHLLQTLLDPEMNHSEGQVNELRKATTENIKRLMTEENLTWSDAWIRLRSYELEDGASYCEENDGTTIVELIEAAKRGAEKRSAKKGAQEETQQEETQCTPYVPPPRVRDADRYWPYMRCKNVARALMPYNYDFKSAPLPRNHHALLEFIANKANMSVEVLKKTNPKNVFRNNVEVDKVLCYTF